MVDTGTLYWFTNSTYCIFLELDAVPSDQSNISVRAKVKIKDILVAPGYGAFFYDDQAAIQSGASMDGFVYLGKPTSAGFSNIRMPATCLSMGLKLEDNRTVWGDLLSVQYSGAGGRDPVFDVRRVSHLVTTLIADRLKNLDASNFIEASAKALAFNDGVRLPLSVEYGVSQALLRAAAHIRCKTMAEVVCEEFHLPRPKCRVPIYCQSGDAREINVDKMILKNVDILPHGLINAHSKFGRGGETFLEFVKWVVSRIEKLGGDDYNPVLHFDVYGMIGRECGLDPKNVAEFILKVSDAAPNYSINIESPADYGSTQAQIENYSVIKSILSNAGRSVRVVVDERCNTLDEIRSFAEARAADFVQIKTPDVGTVVDTVKAVLICKDNGIGAYVGGSCTETDLSAQVSVHVSVATQADMMLAKPGMGVDEALSIVGNEQSRLLAILNSHEFRPDKVDDRLP